MPIECKREGRRTYLLGTPYSARKALDEAGAHWDPERKAWWMGSDEKARALAEKLAAAPAAPPQGLQDSDILLGRGKYRGRACLVLWAGETSGGRRCKLASMDGSRIFWAPADEVSVEKRYGGWTEDDRGREFPRTMTWGRLQRWRAERAAAGGGRRASPHRRRCEGECVPGLRQGARGRRPPPGDGRLLRCLRVRRVRCLNALLPVARIRVSLVNTASSLLSAVNGMLSTVNGMLSTVNDLLSAVKGRLRAVTRMLSAVKRTACPRQGCGSAPGRSPCGGWSWQARGGSPTEAPSSAVTCVRDAGSAFG